MLKTRAYMSEDLEQVLNLWQSAGLVTLRNNPKLDIERKLEVDAELFLVTVEGQKVIATVMGGYEGHRGWVNYLAVDAAYRKKGIARKLMEQLEALLLERGCPKVNLQVRATNKEAVAFYRSLGFKQDEVVSFGKRIIED